MGNKTPKKITTDSKYIYITEEKITIGNIEEKQIQIDIKRISKYQINFTSEYLYFVVHFLNLEICKWIHDILPIRWLYVNITMGKDALHMVRYLIDNSSIYNGLYLSFVIQHELSQEIVDICDSIFMHAVVAFDMKEISLSWPIHASHTHTRYYRNIA